MPEPKSEGRRAIEAEERGLEGIGADELTGAERRADLSLLNRPAAADVPVRDHRAEPMPLDAEPVNAVRGLQTRR
jgi:hypothetical protein